MEQWEYKIIRLEVKDLVKGWINKKVDTNTEQLLNELGYDSWELTGIAPIGGGTGGWGAETSSYAFVFKRKK